MLGATWERFKQSLLDAQAVEDGDVWAWPWTLGRTAWMASRTVLGFDLAGLALVGAGFVFHDGDAVLVVAA